eukprot:PITA_35320
MDLFASPTGIPLHFQVKYSIDLILGAPLPNRQIYRHYVMENDEIKRLVQELLQKGHIRPRYPIPQIDDLLDELNGAKYLINIDLKSGYHKVHIKPSVVWKTTFKSKEGLFEWLVKPFILTSTPETFMRLMDDILQPFTNEFVVVYLDDILFFI